MEFIRQMRRKVTMRFMVSSMINPRMRPRLYWREFLGIRSLCLKALKILLKSSISLYTLPNQSRKKRLLYSNSFLYNRKSLHCKDNEITDRFIDRLEAQIRKDPSQYLWSHNRFKHRNRVPIDEQ